MISEWQKPVLKKVVKANDSIPNESEMTDRLSVEVDKYSSTTKYQNSVSKSTTNLLSEKIIKKST